ncbi:hypothetical protein [Sphingomonas sp. NIBR02145]|uniref:hypothetical protein n=1 Tax=Sphingomonas sp. NIBR02145 TaxID=3014784 RepID=UPI0022B5D75C|nr:hypothetical protein [Sphingomonas sp. NIBR02145]WHU03200.1 hypothetical protein O3305_00885 [Sphingomonas sp. NIBR02145]
MERAGTERFGLRPGRPRRISRVSFRDECFAPFDPARSGRNPIFADPKTSGKMSVEAPRGIDLIYQENWRRRTTGRVGLRLECASSFDKMIYLIEVPTRYRRKGGTQ